MSNPFPLMSLPNKALKSVLQRMDMFQVVAFSVLSNKAKEISQCAGFRTHFEMQFNSESLRLLWFPVKTLTFYWDKPDHVEVRSSYDAELVPWPKNRLSTEEWVERIFLVNSKQPGKVNLAYVSLHEMNSNAILAVIPKIQSHRLHNFSDNFLNVVMPVTTKLELFFNPFPNEQKEKVHSLLMQNLNCLIINGMYFHLDDLYLTNAIKFELRDGQLTDKDLNRFLKMWKAKNCTPRLEHFEMSAERIINYETVLNGLRSVELPQNFTDFHFSKYAADLRSERFFGGFEITRKDGVKGTIVITRLDEDESGIELFVWN